MDASVACIVSVEEWATCADAGDVGGLGPAYLGIDIGGSVSACAAALYVPETGLLKVTGAWPRDPDLRVRGLSDGVGNRYVTMQERGEIFLCGDRWADAGAFVKYVMEWSAGVDVQGVLADMYRKAEVEQALLDAGCDWTMTWRRMGMGSDGTHDVTAFQREVIEGRLRPGHSLALESAIAEAMVREDGNNNARLERVRHRGRIDILAASVLAVGAGARHDEGAEAVFLHAAL